MTAHRLGKLGRVLRYGSATLEGFYIYDTVCLIPQEGTCVQDFKFFEITKARGFVFDGILGMSPYQNM